MKCMKLTIFFFDKEEYNLKSYEILISNYYVIF